VSAGASPFLSVALWEMRLSFRRISTWVYFVIFFALAYVMMLAASGTWSEVGFAIGSGGKVLANAPYALAALFPIISLIGVSITAALAGNAIYRDFDVGIDPLFFTTPVSKAAFLGGRFTGSLVVNLVALSGIGFGAFVATLMPFVNHEKLGPFHVASFLIPYVTHLIPNLLLTGAIFFALAALTRQMLPNYVGGALLLIGYLLSANVFRDIGDKTVSALVDPFGLRAMGVMTEYWSIAERNSRIVPLAGLLLANRLLWLAVAGAIFAFAAWKFRFAHSAVERKAKVTSVPDPAAVRATPPVRTIQLPPVVRRFDVAARWAQFRSVTRTSFWRVVRNRYFGAILGGGLLYLLLAARSVGQLFGTNTYPVTHQMVDILGGTFGLFILVIIAFYSGELVWAERDAHMHQIYDATPVSNVITFLAKLTSMIGVIACLLLVSMIAGILTQASKGYFRFEISVYLETLFGFRLIDMVLLAVLAMTVHVLVNHKYLGHLVVILVFVGMGLLSQFGLEHNLYQYGSDSGGQYSDMNRFGPFVGPFVIWKLYWSAFALLLIVLAVMSWVRGLEVDGKWRVHLATLRFTKPVRALTALSALAFIGLGGFIYYNTNVLNHFYTSKERRRLRADRELTYKKYEKMPQPRITATSIRVDLRPSQGDFRASGMYTLKNMSTTPIDTIHVTVDRDYTARRISFDRPFTRVKNDDRLEWTMYRLAKPLAPGDSVKLHFVLAQVTRGFENQIRNTSVVANGTFLENAQFMPEIGYNPANEISDADDRKKEHLPARPRMSPPTTPGIRDHNYVSRDADWVRYSGTVCTDPDQIALTSGYLQREWRENGRRCFAYDMDAPIINLWAFQSARYAVARDKWNDVNIEVYYHPAHAYNVKRMITAVQRSLDYYTQNFGPYQHRQVRIVEFPRYATFAQSLPNTIPYSEDLGFIARVEKSDEIDYPFYVTAHEVAHQWWAHQVIGADAQGSTLLSESLAQYSALMVMEKEFGAASMRRFLEYELDRYLLGRATERRSEMPISLGENQPYIHYNKGSLVMYALRDYLGEQRMNTAIRGFLDQWKFKGPPYPTSLDFVNAIRAATPDSLKYVIADLFDYITLYELKTDSAASNPTPDGRWRVDLWVNAKKLRSDSLGHETEVPMNDWIDIGVFGQPAKGQVAPDKNGIELYLQKHRIISGAQHLQVVLDAKPSSAGIDPLHKLIDRYVQDNTVFARQPASTRTNAVRQDRPARKSSVSAPPGKADPVRRPTTSPPARARPR
jgi:ABC-2 type transport system permease protein